MDAIKYLFKKGTQVGESGLVEDISRRSIVPQAYLKQVAHAPEMEGECMRIELEAREIVVTTPRGTPATYLRCVCREVLGVVPSSPGSLHIPRATVPADAYAFVVHSAPINSLVSLLSLRCAEILDNRAAGCGW